MNKLFFLFILVLTGRCVAQSPGIVVQKDPRVDQLVEKHIEINELNTRESRRFVPGFRILAISSSDRNKVIEAKTTIYRKFPELTAYLMYQAPFFRLKVGNFKDRLDAEEYVSGIQELFRDAKVYVVPDTIEVRPEPNQ